MLIAAKFGLANVLKIFIIFKILDYHQRIFSFLLVVFLTLQFIQNLVLKNRLLIIFQRLLILIL